MRRRLAAALAALVAATTAQEAWVVVVEADGESVGALALGASLRGYGTRGALVAFVGPRVGDGWVAALERFGYEVVPVAGRGGASRAAFGAAMARGLRQGGGRRRPASLAVAGDVDALFDCKCGYCAVHDGAAASSAPGGPVVSRGVSTMPEAQQSYGVLDYGHFDYGDFFDEPLVPNDGWGLLCTANEELICSAPTPNLFCGARAEPDSPPVETGPGPATPQATPVAVREREEAIRGDAVSVDIVGIAVDAASPAKPRGSVLDEFVRPAADGAPTSEALFWFDFDDPSGGTDTGYGDAFVDASGNGHAISDSSGSSRTTGPSTPARFLGALHGFALDDVAPALAGAGPRTLGAWLRIDAFDGGYALEIGGGAAACENFGLRAGWSEGALELAFKGDCAVSVADAGLAAGRWHHVAVAYDGAAAWTLYVDGDVAASGTAVLDTAGAAPLVVGGTTASPLTGAVDDLFAYGAALDADAVRALRDRGGRTYAPTRARAVADGGDAAAVAGADGAGTPAPSVEHCAHGRGLDFAEFVVDDEIGSPSFTWGVDLDQDGDMDVLTTSLHDNTVAWSENDGNQSFTERLLTSTAMSAAFASYGDVNEDGAFDVLAVSWGDNTTRLFVNDGAMSFFEVQLDSEEAPTDVVVFDFDGDGDTDVLAASWYKGTIFWFEGHGELATYYAKAYIAEGLAGPWNVFPRGHRLRRGPRRPRGDGLRLRGDVVRENDGNMTFAVRVVDTEVIQPREVVARDGDGDGDVDLFVAVRGASELVWYEDDGRQNWEKIVIADDAYGAYTICPTDLDGDGDIDVVGASKEKDEIPWYENDGAMGFGEHMVSTTAVGVRYSIVADMDSDADLDVVAALAGRDCTVWYENGCENQDYAPATSLLALGLEASSAPDSLMTIIAEAEGYDDDVD
ncbi:glutathione transferase [Aureococcus anophagefferens]|nr:glutathione transferase [Aureococcus anophagefferens]